jgi:hypothetical protein
MEPVFTYYCGILKLPEIHNALNYIHKLLLGVTLDLVQVINFIIIKCVNVVAITYIFAKKKKKEALERHQLIY